VTSTPVVDGLPEFDAYAQSYDEALDEGLSVVGEKKEYFARQRLRWVRRRFAERGIAKGGTMLDFGCGTGGSTPYFFEELGVERLIGVDVSEGLLGVARRDFGADSRVSFERIADRPPQGDCDFAFVNGVFHHIPPAERADAFRYVFQSLRHRGLFAFWENNPWNPGTRYVMSRVAFDATAVTITPPEARRLLRDAGFTVVRTDYQFIFPGQLAFLRPLESMLAALPLGGQYLVLATKE
jgi:SAM-dependent methyltransferase